MNSTSENLFKLEAGQSDILVTGICFMGFGEKINVIHVQGLLIQDELEALIQIYETRKVQPEFDNLPLLERH